MEAMKLLTPLIAGIILGLLAYHMLFRPEVKTEIVETIRTETDTVYTVVRDTIEVTRDRIIHEHTRDTVIQEKQLLISNFRGFEPLTYGNLYYNGLVAGEVLNIGFRTDFSIPQVTNTIYRDKTVTRTIMPGGSLWVGASVTQNVEFSPQVAYQNKGWQIGGWYSIGNKEINLSLMKQLF